MMFGNCPWCGGSVGYGTSFWSLGLMLLFGLLVIAGVILLVIWAVRSSGAHARTPAATPDAAMEAARRRYASGEITKEQFDEILRNLGG